jgi:hypothetical protein
MHMSINNVAKKSNAFPLIANTWPEFLDCVRQARSELGNPALIWYRGMSRAEYKLVPSLLRVPKDSPNKSRVCENRLTT